MANLPTKKLLIGIVVVILLALYVLFWLNFFGLVKVPLPIAKQEVKPQYQQEQQKIEAIISFITSLQEPLAPSIDQTTFSILRGGVIRLMREVKNALARGDINEAHQILEKEVLNQFIKLGDIEKEQILSAEEKQKHDPKGKYIKKPPFDMVDPTVKDIYLQIIDLLVETDKDY